MANIKVMPFEVDWSLARMWPHENESVVLTYNMRLPNTAIVNFHLGAVVAKVDCAFTPTYLE